MLEYIGLDCVPENHSEGTCLLIKTRQVSQEVNDNTMLSR